MSPRLIRLLEQCSGWESSSGGAGNVLVRVTPQAKLQANTIDRERSELR